MHLLLHAAVSRTQCLLSLATPSWSSVMACGACIARKVACGRPGSRGMAPAYPPSPCTWPAGRDDIGPWRARQLRLVARRLFTGPHDLPPWAAGAWASIREPLAAVMGQHTGVFLSALALPTVGAPLAAGDLLSALPHLLLELARRGVIGEQGLWWGAPVSRLVSPALGADRRFNPPLVGVLFESGIVTLRPTEEWRLAPEAVPTAWPLEHGGWLLGADTNPLAMNEAHPDKSGNALSFGSVPVAEWLSALNTARGRLHAFIPELAREHANVLVGIVPVLPSWRGSMRTCSWASFPWGRTTR